MTSLRALSQMLNLSHRLNFTSWYGKILDILNVNVQAKALTALTQFYDPPMRSFTFQDFQIAPTLEEFEYILGMLIGDAKPYQYHGHTPSLSTVAGLLNMNPRELQAVEVDVQGRKIFRKVFFEGRLLQLAQAGDWDAFKTMLAVAIYGLVLFPSMEGCISYFAIDVFLAWYLRMENHVPALLADVYYNMNFCHERKGKKILYCLPLLFIWPTTHIFPIPRRNGCLRTDFQLFQLGKKDSKEWAE